MTNAIDFLTRDAIVQLYNDTCHRLEWAVGVGDTTTAQKAKEYILLFGQKLGVKCQQAIDDAIKAGLKERRTSRRRSLQIEPMRLGDSVAEVKRLLGLAEDWSIIDVNLRFGIELEHYVNRHELHLMASNALAAAEMLDRIGLAEELLTGQPSRRKERHELYILAADWAVACGKQDEGCHLAARAARLGGAE